MKLRKIITIGILLTTSIIAVACSPEETTEELTKEQTNLKIGLMPAVDTAPILIAEKNGYFEELGIDVDIEIYTNAQDRQSALQSNSIDGAMTDFIAVATNVDGGFDIKATTMTDGVFPILSNEGAKDKKDIKVGMMEVSVSNYLIDRWLSDEYNIEKVFINEIPLRLAAMENKDLDMSLFPEPVASNGELKGLEKTVYGNEDKYSPDCMVFTGKALNEKVEAIDKFHKAYNMAVEDINENEDIARDILMEKVPNISPEAKDLIVLPEYKKAALPDDEYLNDIITWIQKELNKPIKVEPQQLLDTQFIK